MTVLQIENLILGYRKKRLFDGFSHTFSSGGHILQGANGVGKSTLLSAITGSLPYKGRILIDGHELTGQPVAARRTLGYVPDSAEFYPFVSGLQFVEFVCRAHGCGPATDQPLYQEWIDRFKIRPYLGSLFSQMSLGTKKKFFILAAILPSPALLVMDEPFNGLDDASCEALVTLINQYGSEHTLLLTCHQQSIVEHLRGERWRLQQALHITITRAEVEGHVAY